MEVNDTQMINGKSYDFSQIIMNVLGVPILGVSEINYTEDQEKTNNYGAGKWAISRGHNVIEASGSIKLHMDDVERLREVAPNRRLLEVPAFDITVTFLNGAKTVTHVLKNAEFTNDSFESSQGDTLIENSYDLILSHVERIGS